MEGNFDNPVEKSLTKAEKFQLNDRKCWKQFYFPISFLPKKMLQTRIKQFWQHSPKEFARQPEKIPPFSENDEMNVFFFRKAFFLKLII